MQIGDMIRMENLIGIVTLWSDDMVIAKCHDGLTHTSKPNKCELIMSANDIIEQYEEAIIKYGREQKH